MTAQQPRRLQTIRPTIISFRVMSREGLQDGVLTVDGKAIDPQPVPAGRIRQREHCKEAVSITIHGRVSN